ncbi:unnamed protein product, partial [Ixodes pacificus]
ERTLERPSHRGQCAGTRLPARSTSRRSERVSGALTPRAKSSAPGFRPSPTPGARSRCVVVPLRSARRRRLRHTAEAPRRFPCGRESEVARQVVARFSDHGLDTRAAGRRRSGCTR